MNFWERFVSDRVTSGDDNRRYWSTRLISDAQRRVDNVDSKFSWCVEGIGRVNVVTDDGGGGGEQVRLKDVELIVMSRCFCVDERVGRAKWGVDKAIDDADDDEEQLDSVVFERDKVVESLITAAIVCIAESVSLSTFCGVVVILFCNHWKLFGFTGGGVDKDLCDLSWLVILSQTIIGCRLLGSFEWNRILAVGVVSTTTMGAVRGGGGGGGGKFSSHCFVKKLRMGGDVLLWLWDSNRWIISATRDEDAFVFSNCRGGIGGGGEEDRNDVGSMSETNDCEGRNVILNVFEFNDDWRKNDFNWLLFVVKSFTDVHRWLNVDEDIFFSFSLSLTHHVEQYHRQYYQKGT